MHVKDDIAYSHIDKAINALYKCRDFMTEIDLAIAQEIIRPTDYYLPNNGRISEFLGNRKFEKAYNILEKAFDFNLKLVDRLFPIFVVSKLTESILSEHNSLPLDAYLWEQAQRLNMNCTGLEEPQDQVKVLNAMDINLQMKMLKDTVSNVSKFKKSTLKLIKAYQEQDIQFLYKKSIENLGSFRKILLFDRNEFMTDRIHNNMATATFYAIGAAHLAGQKGILNLLKKRGYQLNPV